MEYVFLSFGTVTVVCILFYCPVGYPLIYVYNLILLLILGSGVCGVCDAVCNRYTGPIAAATRTVSVILLHGLTRIT